METTISVLGGKWKAVILFHLLEQDVLRFGELRKQMPLITQQMLTLQLRELELDGVIKRKVYPVVPPKVEYSLTQFGLTLKPIILAMMDWGVAYRQRMVQK